jgi:DNA-binding PadR family transcriptional regulator
MQIMHSCGRSGGYHHRSRVPNAGADLHTSGRGYGRGAGGGPGSYGGFGDEFDGDGFRGRGHGGMRRRLFDNAELRLLMLHLIAIEPRHGYDLIREIETLSGGAYAPSPGVVYPALTMMTEMEQISEQPTAGTRKQFAITPAGEAHLAEHRKQCDEVLLRISRLSEQAAPSPDIAPVRRAMGNLKAALAIRLRKEGADNDTILDVAALIDETAAKIERLK